MTRWLIAPLLCLTFVACGGSSDDEPDAGATATRAAEQTEVAVARQEPTAPPTQPRPTTHSVEYRITSDPAAVVSLTYQNGSGGTSQQDRVVTPATLTLSMQTGDFVYVSAQNGNYAAEITCTIFVDGVPVASSTSDGAFVIATCDGRV